MDNKNILISGAGIAGTALAFWLKKFGFHPTVVEISPTLREGGYAIDFMGAGYDVAGKMGLLDVLEKVDLGISKLSFVDKNDREKGSMNYRKIKELMNNRALTLLRSDLAKVIYERIEKEVEIIFGDTIHAIEQEASDHVRVTFQSGKTRDFDLVIGADGLHSAVRNIVFGDEAQFEKYYGYYTSSFTIKNFAHTGQIFSMFNVPYKQVAVYSFDRTRTTTFFVFASPEKISYAHHDIARQKEILKAEFINIGWKCPEILAQIDDTPDFYFDSVSQIKMNQWSKGRVSLVGDACYCPSLLSGKGSTLAIVGAYILAGELKQAKGDYKIAFEQYETIFKPFMNKKQESAKAFAKSFVPKSYFGISLRNIALKLMAIPFFSGLFLNQFKDKELKLKEY